MIKGSRARNGHSCDSPSHRPVTQQQSTMADDHAPALYTILDSGAPEGSTDYTTIVPIHGLMWNGSESPVPRPRPPSLIAYRPPP